MSVTYQSHLHCSSKIHDYSIIACSTTDSALPLKKKLSSVEKPGKAPQNIGYEPVFVPVSHRSPKDILEPINSHDLNKLLTSSFNSILLIDTRPFSYYYDSHIKSAIHLTIPSVLLKRVSFQLEKVSQSLTNKSDSQRFKQWQKKAYIVFYDHTPNSSNNSGSNPSAVSMALKFQSHNYSGSILYLQDGFENFKQCFPDYCEKVSPLRMADTLSLFNPNIKQNFELSQESMKERFFIRMPEGKKHRNGSILLSTSPTHHPRYGLGGSSLDFQGNFELPVWLKKIMDQNGPIKLAKGYEQLETLEQKRLFLTMEHGTHPKTSPFPFSVLLGAEKGKLNRYRNVWPYEYSRVRLLDKENDYINANYIQYASNKNDAALMPLSPLSDIEQSLTQSGLLSKASINTMRHPDTLNSARRYITTQGPLPSTFSDFWKMVWNENSHVITMITNEEELDKIQSHQYWPSEKIVFKNYGQIAVQLLSEQKMGCDREDLITIRRFRLRHRSSLFPDRTVTHLQYDGWSDFEVPEHPVGLLTLVYMVDEAHRIDHHNQGPVTVHCSAGCGRTGVFCVVDTTIQRLWYEQDVYTDSSTDKVFETIDRFREQRLSMVQTHSQFVFCYEAILWWLIGYGHLPISPPSD
ncbi:protein-tyrosine phosphatase-like protein [Sporodiniella umbellata]|nr:protein-tyrosine phosphatase-like protein [Sporodiniella umbellata]